MSLLITRRMRQVPPSGAKVSPVRRTCWIAAAVATVKASTRSDGSETATSFTPCSGSVSAVTTSPMPEKSAVDRDVSATSS